jgi:hypothetical protein
MARRPRCAAVAEVSGPSTKDASFAQSRQRVGELRRARSRVGRGAVAGGADGPEIGLAELIERRVRLARHGANSGTKALTVVGSMLLGGDSVADTALLQAGATGELFDRLRAQSTIGSWLPGFKGSNVREFDAVTWELLARLRAAGAGPADPAGPLTFDLDSTICPVYGRAKQGAGFGYTKVRGYHQQLAALCPRPAR